MHAVSVIRVEKTSGTTSFSPVSLTPGERAVQTMTVPGASVGRGVIVNPPSVGTFSGANAILMLEAYCSAPQTVSVKFYNIHGAATIAPVTPTATDPWVVTLL